MIGDSSDRVFDYHANLLLDRGRLATFERAIRQTVKPGDVVLDLGSGTGVLAFLACRAGARRVYAVERGEVADLCRILSTANGLDDRVVLLNESSYRISLPERADVVVTDTFHTFALQDGMLGSLIDARNRLLKPHGLMVPRSIELFVVPAELPGVHARFDAWGDRPGLADFSAARAFATNNLYSIAIDREALKRAALGNPGRVVQIALTRADRANVSGHVECAVSRAGVMHGLAGWFVAELSDGALLSNSPDIMTVSWKNAFLPLESAVQVTAGDRIGIAIDTCDGAAWRWRVSVNGTTLPERTTLRGLPVSKTELRKLAPAHRPRRTVEGDAEALVLERFDGAHTLREIEEEIRSRWPEPFASGDAAAALVRDLARRCS